MHGAQKKPAINHWLKVGLGYANSDPTPVNDSGFEPDYCLEQIRSDLMAQRYDIFFEMQTFFSKKNVKRTINFATRAHTRHPCCIFPNNSRFVYKPSALVYKSKK
jgi:hypothetical protein